MNKKNIVFQKLKNFIIQNKIPVWCFGERNAYLVTSIGILYNDIFTFLTSYIFTGDLCLHKSIDELDEEFNYLYLSNDELEGFKFFHSNLTPKQHYKKYVCIFSNYKEFFYSAIFYYLESIFKKNNLSFFIYLFSRILIVNETSTSALYKDIKTINIFSIFPLECLNGVFSHFTDYTIDLIYSNNDRKAFFALEKRHNVFRFINIFSFYFSPRFRANCFKDCLKAKNHIPMFIALKVYQTTLLFPNLSLNQLNKVKSISSFKKTLLSTNSISKKNINNLIEKNWKYHNYE